MEGLKSEAFDFLSSYHRVFVGYSGGLDSTVLLHALALTPLKEKLVAVHINHGISPHASQWQIHCEQFCSQLKIPFIAKQVQIAAQANVEEEARNARYAAFGLIVNHNECVVTAHHQDDQIETFFLQLIRGAGLAGLTAIVKTRAFYRGDLIRPLLSYSRFSLKKYAERHRLHWIEDESNANISFSRNYLRHQLMPLLYSRWPSARTTIERTSLHCQEAQANLEDLAKLDCPHLQPLTRFPLLAIAHLSVARKNNVLRFWLKMLGIHLSTQMFQQLIEEVMAAKDDAIPELQWQGVCIRRYQQNLYVLEKNACLLPERTEWQAFPASLVYPQENFILHAVPTEKGLVVPSHGLIVVQFRQGGESFYWHGQTKQLKKLFQAWGIPPWERGRVPLLFIDDQLACIVGYAISDRFYGEEIGKTYEIQRLNRE